MEELIKEKKSAKYMLARLFFFAERLCTSIKQANIPEYL